MDLFLLCEDQSYTLSRDNFWGLWPFLASSQSSTPQRAFWGLSCYLQVKVGIGFRLKLGWHRGLILVLNQRTEPKSVVYMPFPLCVLRCLCMLLPNFHLMSVYSTCAVRFVSSLVCLSCLFACACHYCMRMCVLHSGDTRRARLWHGSLSASITSSPHSLPLVHILSSRLRSSRYGSSLQILSPPLTFKRCVKECSHIHTYLLLLHSLHHSSNYFFFLLLSVTSWQPGRQADLLYIMTSLDICWIQHMANMPISWKTDRFL